MSFFDNTITICTKYPGISVWDCKTGYSEFSAILRYTMLSENMSGASIRPFKYPRIMPRVIQSRLIRRQLAPDIVLID